MNCVACNRQLKNPTSAGMGKICARKHKGGDSGKAKKIRIEMLHRSPERRSYKVFTDPSRRVVVNQFGNEKRAKCDCSENIKCFHIQLVAEIDNEKYPKIL